MESTETLGSEQMGTDRDPGDQKHPTTSQQPRDSKMQLAKVLLPDGVQKEFEVNKNSEGEALFRQVTRDLSIEEREYFSLCFYDKDEGTRHWLYNDKNIAKQIKGLPWEFSFEVKFYPTTPTTIVDDHARYYVFLQLRRDLLTGRLPATADTHSLLGSFVAQIEFGDAPAEMTDAYEQFIVASKLVPSAQANPETYKKIVDLHREMRGQTPSEAENQFLDHCKHLALYGIHLFKAISDKDKKPVDVGIGAAGINIYQDEQKTHSFSWQNIIKIGYRRTYFSIKLKAGTVEKNEKTLYFKLPNHVAAKRTWKCAVEHHTFFRLIQPEDKTHKSFFNFGSQRFRYQGRTQFQTKIASQMFDKPSTVDRAPSAMSQPIATAENQKLQTLNLTDSELEQRQFERYRRALTPKSYTSSRQDDDAVSTATFAKYSRPSTLLVVSTSGHHQQSPHELSYSPRGDDSSNYSSAAYYMSERSSLRTPSSAYYPPSEYTSPTSPVYFEGQHHGEYHVQMRQTASTSATGPSNSGARRNLFGRASDARSSQASRDSVRLVSFHEPVDPNEPIPNTYPYSELPQIPIERIVHVYHEGHYDRLSPRRQQRPELPYGFGNYTPRNGVSHVDNLQPDGEMDQQPIRFYVDVRHSGASRRNLAKRLSHPGKEDIKEQIDPKDYYFSASLASDPIHRTELSREVQPANIQQYTRRYHHGDSIHKPDTPQYRLITHVHPLAVTNRDGRDGQSSSNLNATISQREQVVSTKVRRESPDADRRVRLSASVDRSGNLTDTTEEMTRSTNEAATPTTVVTTRIVEKKGKGKKNNQKIPPSSNKTDHASFEGQEKRSRFGGFFTKKTSQTLSGYPESTSQFTGELDATHRDDDLEPSTFSHSNKSQQYSSKQDKTIITSVESKSDSGNKKRLMAVESPEVPKKYRLIARIRHEGDEDVVEKPEKYSFVTDSHSGMLEETYRQKELDQIPISSHAAVYHHGKSWSIQRQSTLSQDRSKISSLGADDANLSKKKEVRLIARIESKTEEVAHKKHKKEGSSVFGFFNRPTKLPAGTEYPEKSNVFTGDLDTTGRTSDLEQHPFQHGTHPAYSPKNVEAYQPSENSNGESKTDIPAAYGFPSTSYDGPLETTSLERDLQHVTIAAHSNVYHHGDSSRIEKHASPVATPEKKQKKVKSPKKEKVDVPAEPEKKEIRLIARVRTEPEAEIVDVPVVKETKEKKGDSKSKLPTFGFFSKTTKTTKTTGYPETSEAYTEELDTTDRIHDLEGTSFEHGEHSAYSPKQTVIETIETPAEPEKKRYRLIARFRHEGDEDVVEKPDPYQIATTLYDGPLDEISRETDLDHAPIADHANVYHHGDSSRIEKHASPVATLEKKQKKVKSPKKEKVDVPAEPEKKEIRLIARVRTEPEAEIVDVPVVKETKEKKGDSKSKLPTFGFFSKTTKTTKTTGYPETSEAYTGELDTTDRTHDLEGTSFEHGEHPAYSPKQTVIEAIETPAEPEKKRYRLIARFRHEGDEDVVEKPDPYQIATTLYDGPLDEISRETDLDHTPIADHANVYHHGDSSRIEKHASPVATPEKKQKKVKSPKKEKVDVPAEPEKKEIRLIARVRTEPEAEIVDVPVVKETKEKKGDSKSKLPTFGFFSKTTKTTKTTGYPETSEAYTGELDTTDRIHDLEGTSFEHGEHPAYSPKQTVIETIETPAEPEKKRYRLIARFRHEGDEDVVEKPDPYQIATTLYDGPLDEISRETDLDHTPIADHANVYHHGDSSRIEKHASPVATLEKKQKKVKSPKKEKVDVPAEPEKKEIRLIARVRTEPEAEIVDVPVVKETKEKKGDSKSKLPTFGFFSKTTKTTKTTGYPETSEAYTGELDTTDRTHDFEGTSFEHGEHPAYSPKQTVIEAIETPAEPEKKRYRLIARFRHEGDEDVVEKPDPYQIATTLYDGPLDEISRETDLDHAPIADHANVYHHGDSSRIEKHASPVATLEKKQKKVKSPKKEKVDVPAEPEKKEIRLIARVRTEPEAEIVDVPVVKETKEKKGDSKSKLPTFGFFSKTTKTTKTTGYPETSEAYTGELDTTDRTHDLEGTSFEHGEHPAYSPKQTVIEAIETPAEPEKKRYRLIARFRHEGDEDVVEKPDPYQIATTLYDGPLDEISRETDLDHAPIADHANVYHHGDSSRIEKHASPVATLEKKQKKVKSPKKEKVDVPAEPEKKEIRLIARVRTEPEAEIVDVPVVKETKEKKGDSKSKLPTFGFFSKTTKTTKTTGYPETSEAYTGELDTTDRIHDLEGTSFEHGEHPAYSPKQTVIETIETPAEPEKKRYRLIARFRHEGDEDVVEKPDPYQIATTLYDGPLDEISRETDLDHTPIADHANVYHHGDSSRIEKHASPVATLEKKQKKVKSPKKEKVDVPAEPEKKEIRLIARVRTEPEAEIVDVPVVKETKEKKGDSKSKLPTFGFFSKTTKTTKTTGYPETSEAYTGELDTTDRTHDLEGTSFEHGEHPAYSPKQTVIEAIETPAEPEKKRYRLIARFRHEGDEDVVEKPDPYQIATTLYDGPLDEISRETDLDHTPIADHANVYHHGDSSRIEKHASPVATLEKKQKKVKSPKKEKVDVPAEPEKKEIRLIARVRTEPEAEIVDVPVVKETKEKKGDSKSKLPTFGFFSKTTKTTKTTGYPETSEAYTGELDTTDRTHDLEGTSFEHGEHPAYSPKQTVIEAIETPAEPEKKRYRLIARFRHEGDEDVVEKPDPYQIATTLYDGPLDEISRETDLDHAPIADHANVYHHGDSSRIEKHASPVATLEKKQKKVKSPKKEKVDVPAEPEKKEIRLIARVRTEPEAEIVDVPVVKETKEKKGDSKSKLPTFGFFSKTTKTTKTTGYPETSEAYTGELDTTDRIHDLEGTSFEHGEHPAYSPKQTVIETIETPAEPEKKRYRLIARFRHEGDEDVVEKPDPYQIATTLYDGPLDEISRETDLDHTPIADHANVYHHGDTSRIEKHASPVATLEKKQKMVKSPKKEKVDVPAEPEKKEIRLIARVRTEPEAEIVDVPVVKETKEKKGDSKSKLPTFGFFSKTTKTTKTTGYPETSEAYTGELDTTDRIHDLEGTSFEHGEHPAYSPKQTVIETIETPAEPEKKRYRLIARFRHEGDEDVVEKPDPYQIATTLYDGPLDEISRETDLDHTPIADHANVYHHGDSSRIEKHASPVATLEKKQKKVKSPKKEKVDVPAEPEKKEIRLIARVRTEPEAEIVDVPVVKETKEKKGDSKSKLPTFGFFSKTTKTTKTTGYPETSEAYTGELDTTDRTHDLEGTSFEHGEHPAYSPKQTVIEAIETPAEPEKKRYRLIARFRHEGDEDVVEKPDPYQIATTLYDGPLDEISRETDLDHAPIADHANVYHHGDSSRIEKHASPVATLEKKQKKVKSPKKEKVDVPAEPEKKEIRLIARVRTEPEAEIVDVPVVKETKEKKGDSKSKLPTFGFFSKTTKTTKTTGYPETSEAYTGELDTTDRIHDLEGTSFEHGEHPAYSPKQTVIETIETPAEPEKKRYRLIARFRHEGDEDVVEKPDPYQIATTLYDGPLDEISRETDLDHTPIADHANVYHHGDSSRIEKHASPVATLEKKQKKVKSPKKEKVDVPAEPEKKEIRLIARVRTEPEAEIVDVPVVKETKEKKGDSKSKLPTFGFFSKTTKTTKTTGYPETSEAYTGELDTTDRTHDLEGTSFEHGEHPAYSPKQTVIEAIETPAEPEKKRYRLIARFRHEGDEDVVEKPDPYQIATTLYDGPLDEISRETDLDHAPIADHANVYHHGDSSRIEKHASPVATLEKKQKKVKSPKKEKVDVPAEPEKKEIRLIARVRTEPEAEIVDVPVVKETKEKKGDSKSKLPTFGFFSKTTKTTKTTGYPETSEAYTGELDTTDRIHDLEGTSFEHGEHPAYSPKQTVIETIETPAEPEKKRYRLIARFRHEGDEDVVEKPDPYQIATTLYDGPLDEISRETDLDHTPIADHANVYHHGDSSRIEKHASPVATLEKKQKKVKSPKKEKVDVPAEPEKKEIRLIARVRTEPEAEIVDVPVVKETKEKKGDSKSKLPTFGFFSKTTKTTKTTGYPETSEAYTGELDTTDRTHDLEGTSFEHGEHPAFEASSTSITIEAFDPSHEKVIKKPSRFHWFSRWRHEGDEDVVEKPEGYILSSEIYEGPYDNMRPIGELELTPILDHSQVYHNGESGKLEKRSSKEKRIKTPSPERVEPSEIKLVARIQPLEHVEDSEISEKLSPVKDRSRAPSFSMFHRQSKQRGYPEISPLYEGNLDVTGRAAEVENTPIEVRSVPEYHPKQEVSAQHPESSQPNRFYRLIARWRHEGDEDEIEKPDAYKFVTEVYEGPLDDIRPVVELAQDPISDHSQVYHNGESWKAEKNIKPPKPVRNTKKGLSPEPIESEVHEIRLLTRVASSSEEPEEVDVIPAESTPVKPFRLRFLSIGKKSPTSPDSEFPECSPQYDGPVDLTSRSDELEVMPYLHGSVPPYSPKFTPVKKVDKADEERKKYTVIYRFRHEGEEDFADKPEAYGFSSDVYTGSLNEISRSSELEHAAIHDHSQVYHDGLSYKIDNKQKKSKDRTELEEPKTSRLVARVLPQQEASDSGSPKKDDKDKGFRFRFFSKASPKSSGYPEVSPTFEGPIDVTGRVESLEHVPLQSREFPTYSPRKSQEKPSEKSSERTVEPKRYHLIARIRHEGDEETVENPDTYGFASTSYDGPLEETSKSVDVEETPISVYSNVYHHGESIRVEKRQRKAKISAEPEKDDDQENVPPKSRFSFLRGGQKRVLSYPSTLYSGPLETTDRDLDLENIPLSIPVHGSSDQHARKYRLIARIRHAGDEDEVAAHKLHPVFYSFPAVQYSGILEKTALCKEVDEVPIGRFARVYHSGSSGGLIWNLLKNRNSRASKDMDEPKRKRKDQKDQKDIKLIARVLPMKKTPEKSDRFEKATKEEPLREAELVRSTQSEAQGNISTVSYIPSSLTYDVPRPARIEGYTYGGDCYVEIRHERRAEVHLEPVYVLQETNARSHAYLSTATAVFSGASTSAAAADSGANSSTNTTSHSLVLPSFAASVSEDETGIHHFSWTPLHMSPQPEKMSFLARLGFKRDKSNKKDKKKRKKGENETSGETSDSEHDEKREFAIVEFEPHAPTSPHEDQLPPKKPEHRTHKSPGRRVDEPMNEVTVVVTSSERPKELKNTKEVRHETREQQFRLTGDGYTSGFNPNDPSLMATIQRAERLNASSPRLEHAERTFTVRANAPLPVSFEESGQPYTTVSTWQETSDLPEQVEVYTDENGRQITRTVKSSQVKHTVQTQSFQNYIVDGDQVPVGVVDVERSREQLTPLGQKASSSTSSDVQNGGGENGGIVETQTRTMTYEAQGGENSAPPGWAEEGLGEYVSSKSVTQGNRTIETITYKTEKDGIVETHVEHRVTIHSDGDIDHDAELSQAILEATQMNPDMVVEKIEVRQETTQ